MRYLRPGKLRVIYGCKGIEVSPVIPRKYTLTHSDSTGDLMLTVGEEYDHKQISGLYTRIMRDEVLAEWTREGGEYILNIYCHVRGGLVLGSSSMRESIFLREMPLVLEALRFGDRDFFMANPELDEAKILVHLQSSGSSYRKVAVGKMSDFK